MKPATKQLPDQPNVTAPDGSAVRILLKLECGSMSHFHLEAGRTSKAIVHRTVEEIWYCVDGDGQMWRKTEEEESVTAIRPGTCLTIPVGTHFQFRARNDGLSFVAVTMPPWPGDDDAVFVDGVWEST